MFDFFLSFFHFFFILRRMGKTLKIEIILRGTERRIYQGISRIMARPAGRIRNKSNCRGSSRVGSGGARNITGRVRSLSKLTGWVGSGRPETDTNREKRPVKSPGIYLVRAFTVLGSSSGYVLLTVTEAHAARTYRVKLDTRHRCMRGRSMR